MFRSSPCHLVIARVLLTTLALSSVANGLSGNFQSLTIRSKRKTSNDVGIVTEASGFLDNAQSSTIRREQRTFNDCDNLPSVQRANGHIIRQIIQKLDGKEVTIDGILATNLKCIGGGDHGVAFSGNVNGEKVIVKATHKPYLIKVRHTAAKMASVFFSEVPANNAATGAQSFTPQKAEGFIDGIPHVMGQIWTAGVGKNWMQIQDDGGFTKAADFMEFMKKSCEAIAFMWSVGIRHGDIQRANMMWDDNTRKVTLIDYENMQFQDPDGYNKDLNRLDEAIRHYKRHYPFDHSDGEWQPVVNMVDDLHKHKEYRESLHNFTKFYSKHFHATLTLPEIQRDSNNLGKLFAGTQVSN
jgi:predicted Ser/Thr protein kinase